MNVSKERALEIYVRSALWERYNGEMPAKVTIGRSQGMMLGLQVTVSIPGQDRVIMIPDREMMGMSLDQLQEHIRDEVLFAVFLLLDEDEEDA